MNRYGGDIFLGIADDKTVVGVPQIAAPEMVKNFIKIISNPNIFQPTVYLDAKIINYERKSIIHIHVPPSSEVHSFKKVIYDRVNDADIKVTATSQIAAMYIRKQNIFTEKKVYPYLTKNHLRMDLLPKIRKMAANYAGGQHPWEKMDDEELLRSAGLYGEDISTGQKGYNLAAAMLLGKDETILSMMPGYRTDAILRKINTDRYDDRLIVQTNLIDSYEQLMGFAEKHLWDKFFLEGDRRISLRNIIAREMLVNTLIHREMTSPYIAKFVIENEKMFVENANRSFKEGLLTPDDFEPNPKNPIIAAFFRNIGLSDQLGSGVRNLFKYGKIYSGREPELVEGDIFRIVIPLNNHFSPEKIAKNSDKKTAIKNSDKKTAIKNSDKKTSLKTKSHYEKILNYMRIGQLYKSLEIAEMLGLKQAHTRKILKELVSAKKIEAIGSNRNRYYKLK